jgi:hypothetical protein
MERRTRYCTWGSGPRHNNTSFNKYIIGSMIHAAALQKDELLHASSTTVNRNSTGHYPLFGWFQNQLFRPCHALFKYTHQHNKEKKHASSTINNRDRDSTPR